MVSKIWNSCLTTNSSSFNEHSEDLHHELRKPWEPGSQRARNLGSHARLGLGLGIAQVQRGSSEWPDLIGLDSLFGAAIEWMFDVEGRIASRIYDVVHHVSVESHVATRVACFLRV